MSSQKRIPKYNIEDGDAEEVNYFYLQEYFKKDFYKENYKMN